MNIKNDEYGYSVELRHRTILIETFSNFGLKIVDFIDHENVYHIVFEGTYSNLKKWYEVYYDSGESFDDYFDTRTQYSFKSMYPKG